MVLALLPSHVFLLHKLFFVLDYSTVIMIAPVLVVVMEVSCISTISNKKVRVCSIMH